MSERGEKTKRGWKSEGNFDFQDKIDTRLLLTLPVPIPDEEKKLS